MKSGKVILVGAGAGGNLLISRLAEKKLREADVVVTDRLIDPQILAGIDENKLIYVGKSSGQSHTQQQINTLLVELAKTGKTVVRLKV